MGNTQEISSLSTGTLADTPNWIFPASEIAIYGSTDGQTFNLIAQQALSTATKSDPIARIPTTLHFTKTSVRYVKVVLKGTIIPDWHEGKGTPALLFVDEIQIK